MRGAQGRAYEGIGIGLALVQELVRLHKGAARIESELGKGSRFIVTIPTGSGHLSPARPEVSRKVEDPSQITGSHLHEVDRWLAGMPDGTAFDRDASLPVNFEKTDPNADLVFISDDNADMREYVTRILSACFRVETARGGKKAIEKVERLHPSLVLADVMVHMEADGSTAVTSRFSGSYDPAHAPTLRTVRSSALRISDQDGFSRCGCSWLRFGCDADHSRRHL